MSDIHWDLICEMHEGGEIKVDGMGTYRNGVLHL